jgi:hypothetical protein
MNANLKGQVDAGSLGAGRAKLRLSRGFPQTSPNNVTPNNSRSDYLIISRRANKMNFRVTHFLS